MLLTRSPAVFILNFNETPLQEEHKTIFISLSEINCLYLVKVTLQHSFQQSAILSVTLTLTFPLSWGRWR
jgi:hypothetical protein